MNKNHQMTKHSTKQKQNHCQTTLLICLHPRSMFDVSAMGGLCDSGPTVHAVPQLRAQGAARPDHPHVRRRLPQGRGLAQ